MDPGFKVVFSFLLSAFLFSCRVGVDEPGDSDHNQTTNLPVPTNLSLEYDSLGGTVTLDWESGGGDDVFYNVFRDTAQGAGPTSMLEDDEYTFPPFIDFELPALQGDSLRLYYKVQAVDLEGNVSPMASFPVLRITGGGVDGGNVAPQILSIGDTAVNEWQTLSVSLEASDPDGDAFNFSLVSAPEGVSLSGNTFSWTPTDQQSGSYLIRVVVTDDGTPPLSDTAQFIVTVRDAASLAERLLGRWNIDSVFASYVIYESGTLLDSSADLTVTAGENYFQFSGDSLTTWHFTDTALGEPLTETFKWWVEGDSIGIVELDSVAGGPGSNYLHVQIQGNAAVFSIVAVEEDEPYRSVQELVFYTSTGTEVVNEAPVFDPVSDTTVQEGQAISFVLSAADPDGDSLTFTMPSASEGADLIGNAFSWTPGGSQSGSHLFRFVVTDDGQPRKSDTLDVTITVIDINQPPALDSIADTTINEGQSLTLTLNASEPDGDSLVYRVFLPPGGLAVTGNTLTWTPDYNQSGTYLLNVIVTEATPDSLSDTATVTITVLNQDSSGLISHWDFNEGSGTTLTDNGENGNDGAINGAAWAQGIEGGALYFDGVDDYVDVGRGPTLDNTQGYQEFSITVWVNPDGLSSAAGQYIAGKTGNAGERSWQIAVVDHSFSASVFDGASGDESIASTGAVLNRMRWYHLAFVFDGASNRIRLYVDGSLEAEVGNTISSIFLDNGHSVKIGQRGAGTTSPYSGLIDELRFYNRVLAADEITAEWDGLKVNIPAPNAPTVTAPASPTDNMRPTWNWTSGGNGSGTFRYKLDDNDLNTGSTTTEDSSFTPANDLANGSHTLYVQESNGADQWSAAGSASVTVDTVSLEAHWDFNEGSGTTLTDRTGNGNDGVISGAAWTGGIEGGGLEFASGNSVQVNQSLGTYSEWTIGVWFLKTSTGSPQYLLDARDGGSFYLADDGGGGIQLNETSLLEPSEYRLQVWNFLSITGDAQTLSVYLNGNSVRSASALSLDFGSRLIIGGSSTGDEAFAGILDEVSINNRALTAAEIAARWDDFKDNIPAPNAPVVTAPASPTGELRPTWTWTSGGNGNGTFRYKLDDTDLNTGSTATTDSSFTPATDLNDGIHTLYVQESNGAGKWSAAGSAGVSIVIPPGDLSYSRGLVHSYPVNRAIANNVLTYSGTRADSLDVVPALPAGLSFNASNGTISGTPTGVTAAADYTVTVYNSAGQASIVVNIEVLPVPDPPSVNAPDSSSDRTPTWTWTSGGGGNGTFRYKLDNSNLSSGATTTLALSYTPSSNLSYGNHTLYVQEQNDEGIWSLSGSAAVVVTAGGGTLSRVILFEKGGQHTSSKTYLRSALQRLSQQHGFQVQVTSSDAEAFEQANLDNSQILIFSNNDGNLPASTYHARIENFVKVEGKGIMAVHAACAFVGTWTFMQDVCVQQYYQHNSIGTQAEIYLDDGVAGNTNHGTNNPWTAPMLEGLPNSQTHSDEWFSFRDNPRTTHQYGRSITNLSVLLSIDESSYSPVAPLGDHPIIWTHDLGAGRVMVHTPGHEDMWTQNSPDSPYGDTLFWRQLQYLSGGL